MKQRSSDRNLKPEFSVGYEFMWDEGIDELKNTASLIRALPDISMSHGSLSTLYNDLERMRRI